jgi:hypothetical protein
MINTGRPARGEHLDNVHPCPEDLSLAISPFLALTCINARRRRVRFRGQGWTLSTCPPLMPATDALPASTPEGTMTTPSTSPATNPADAPGDLSMTGRRGDLSMTVDQHGVKHRAGCVAPGWTSARAVVGWRPCWCVGCGVVRLVQGRRP